MDFNIKCIVANYERYKDFTVLETPKPFSELYKDQDIGLVQVHTAEPAGNDNIIGFCGVFKWENNKLTPLDGDIYNEDMLVLAYSVFETPDTVCGQALDILVGNDW